MGHPMKTNKSTPSPKGSTPAKAPPSAKASKSLKAATSPAKVLVPQEAQIPQASTTPPLAHSADEVALRAYHNFQKRGSADGDHHGDWLQAEAELTAERRLAHA